VTVVPFETVAVCGLKAKVLMVIVKIGDTMVWFGVVFVWGVGAVVITAVANGVTTGVGAVVITAVANGVTTGVGAVVITAVANGVTTGVGAVVTWVGVGVGPYGGTMHPAISTVNRVAAPRIKDHLPDKSVLIKIPHNMISSVG
jgi:hypothetical protein